MSLPLTMSRTFIIASFESNVSLSFFSRLTCKKTNLQLQITTERVVYLKKLSDKYLLLVDSFKNKRNRPLTLLRVYTHQSRILYKCLPTHRIRRKRSRRNYLQWFYYRLPKETTPIKRNNRYYKNSFTDLPAPLFPKINVNGLKNVISSYYSVFKSP